MTSSKRCITGVAQLAMYNLGVLHMVYTYMNYISFCNTPKTQHIYIICYCSESHMLLGSRCFPSCNMYTCDKYPCIMDLIWLLAGGGCYIISGKKERNMPPTPSPNNKTQKCIHNLQKFRGHFGFCAGSETPLFDQIWDTVAFSLQP